MNMPKRRSRLLVALAAIPLIALAACGSSGGNAAGSATNSSTSGGKSTIVIGNIGLYSGSSFGGQYVQTVHALQAWVDLTNSKGGLNGHPVKLVSHDDQGDPAKSLQYVKQMVEKDHIVAIIGQEAPGTDIAWAKYVTDKGIPVIGGQSLDQAWENRPLWFSTNVTNPGWDLAQMRLAKNTGTKAGLLLCAELANCKQAIPLLKSSAEKVGVGWAGAQFVAATAPDYTAQCAALKQAGADVVLPEVAGPTAVRVIDACATQQYKPAIVMASALIDKNMLEDSAFDGAVGISVAPLWFGNAEFTREFRDAYTKLYPDEALNGFATLGWQSAVVFAAAMAHAPDTVTPQTVADAMWAQPPNSTYGGWTQPLTFTKGKASTPGSCVWIAGIKDGQLTAPRGYQAVCD